MPHTAPVISLPAELHAFVLLVLGDPALQQRLGNIVEPGAFVAEARAVAAERGIALDPAILKDALRPDPLGLGRFGAAPIELGGWPPTGWLPTRSVPTGGAPAFDWLWFGDRPLTQPFFEDEVRRFCSTPLNWLLRIRTGMAALIAGAGQEPELPLQGLIFHMSRCGSTLLAQMLSSIPEVAVLSEPEPLDGVVQWARFSGVDRTEALTAIRAIVAALGRARGNVARQQVIKTDAWHAFSLALLRDAFPEVNWVHLYRDSTEVMVSTLQQPGVHTAPGALPPEVVGFSADPGMSHEEFAAAVLARIGQAVIDNWELGGGMVVAYPDVPEAARGSIAAHFGLQPDGEALAAMAAAGLRDAKDPVQAFASDGARKQAAATPAVAAVVAKWMAPVETKLALLAGKSDLLADGSENARLSS